MLKQTLAQSCSHALKSLVEAGKLPSAASLEFELQEPKSADHGDYASSYALANSKALGLNPRVLAETIAEALRGLPEVQTVDIAGPGFLNLTLKPEWTANWLKWILEHSNSLGNSVADKPLNINVEFVSVNPNGPITVGSGRGAALGDTLCRVLKASGHKVSPEYYINDGVNSEQMRLFAASVKHYCLEATGHASEFPENGYKGEYVQDVAKQVLEEQGAAAANNDLAWYQAKSQELMIARQREDLKAFGVQFDTWFSEQTLHDSGKVNACIDILKANGYADNEPYSDEVKIEGKNREVVRNPEEPGPTWLRSTRLGDDKDRVLTRSDGRPAYISADIAYLKDKFDRGFDKSILIVGPDHHGYVPRLQAMCQALGYPLERFQIVVFQVVRFLRDGKPAPMRKRDGNIYELRDLINEVGSDVTRFFYLMRSLDTHMDFDIDLALKQSDDNPVYYAQYAHARICSVLSKGQEAGLQANPANAQLLTHPRELALVKKILDLGEEVQRAATDLGVHRLTTYSVELARAYHGFYDQCRVIQPDQPELSAARLALCQATKAGLQAAFALLGVSAPEHMERTA